MWQIEQRSFGGPDVFERVQAPRPTPGPGEVLVRVVATSVNAADWKVRSGLIRSLGEPPLVLGLDVSGVVAQVGDDATLFAPGEAVYGMVFGGANAEYVLAQESRLARVPVSIDPVHAAALPVAGVTAWQALASVRSGERVLVHAAAGGVGHLAVQIAARRGAWIAATARSGNHAYLRGLGVTEPIDYPTTDFTTAVREVDLVLDLIGGDYTDRSLTVLSDTGRVVAAEGPPTHPDSRVHRLYVDPTTAALDELAAAVDRGELTVDIAEILPITELAAAHRRSESGRVRGKIVLTADR
ncbi:MULTISPECIES: NADP-dependent oxidoreductase [Nocardia]|uniref:NADP-dependent oxidoreductase n=1 Tax=Nocardia TaxID=1817 RepID=UPI0006FC4B72|nr:NADP-dependent oxidoreductase [Nocardia sp. Root136]KQY37644.1 NADPH:quinone reductase [Nocardia sp. Root136]